MWLLEILHGWVFSYMTKVGFVLFGDSPSTPPPDPELVDAQVNAMNIQSDIAGQLVGLSEQLLPYQIAEMEFGLMAAETAYNDSREDREYTLERRDELTGLQDLMIGDATSYNSEAKQEEAAATAVADAEAMSSASEATAARDLARRGVNPASGASLASSNASSIANTGIKVAAANSGRTQAREEGYMLTDRAANTLAGYPSMSMTATQNSAVNGTAGLTVANQAVGGITSGFSAAAGASTGSASTASSLYGDQMGAYNSALSASAQQSAANTQAAGAIAGMAAYAMISDRSMKVNIVRVGDDPRGFGWYTFDYLGGARGQFGVMAQEVQSVIPGAVTQKHGVLAVNYSML